MTMPAVFHRAANSRFRREPLTPNWGLIAAFGINCAVWPVILVAVFGVIVPTIADAARVLAQWAGWGA